MLGMIVTFATIYVWVSYAQAFSLCLYWAAPQVYALTLYQYGPTILAGLLIAGLVLLSTLKRALSDRGGSDGLWNSGPGRRAVGIAAGAALFTTLMVSIGVIVRPLLRGDISAAFIACCIAWMVLRHAKILLGRTTRPLRRFIGSRHVGMGGTARFLGILDDWAHPWRPGQILLGASLYDPRWLIGIDDDRHITTIATSRAGKGRSVIIPNLLTWPGSALVIDPKGQNACVTALKRGFGGENIEECLGQTVRILDPLGEITDPKVKLHLARFNPLAELDLTAPDYSERIDLISDALVVPTSSKDSFFDNSARALISGLIDYVMISKSVGDYERNLATVRGLLIHPDGPPLDEMAELGGLAQAGAAGALQAGKNAAGDVISTAIAHTKWLDSIGMQRALAASDFSLRDLNDGNTTVYLVLPPQFLDVHGRFLRLFFFLWIG